MTFLLLSIVVPLAGGALALLLSKWPRAAIFVGVGAAILGCVLGLIPAIGVLSGNGTLSLKWAWQVPYGSFSLGIDQLSGLFLIVLFGLTALAAIYGGFYLYGYTGNQRLGASWFFFNIFLSSMTLVIVARNGMLFLVAWEVMAIASFFLVTFEHEKWEVRAAGRTYLIATHIGTAFLLAFFAVLGREAGSLDFSAFGAISHAAPATVSILFILAIVGFGSKAGFVPFHVWLPEAHPAAPSHISAIMSGVMIKLGLYGILRFLTLVEAPPAWWGILLITIGATSGILGVLFALAQHDLKRLLAYHSIENIGIITLGIGVGVWGTSHALPAVALIGFSGALLHIVNHAIFKGLLFLGAGSVLHSTGTREMDKLGGLLKKMPITGVTFLVGAIAISGLPPLNGFISEYLIFFASFKGATSASASMVVPLLAVIVPLALIGGLALACFTKAFGSVFLGEARSNETSHTHESNPGFLIPMIVLAGLCILIGLIPTISIRLVLASASQITASSLEAAQGSLLVSDSLRTITIVTLVALGLLIGLVFLRARLLARRDVRSSTTWDCGYELPTPRMQYTSSSFAQPLVALFRSVLRPKYTLERPEGYFPKLGMFRSETPDVFTDRLYRPFATLVEWTSYRLYWLQNGRLHLYILYIFITLVILLIVRLGL